MAPVIGSKSELVACPDVELSVEACSARTWSTFLDGCSSSSRAQAGGDEEDGDRDEEEDDNN
jgi:hypothetical protein